MADIRTRVDHRHGAMQQRKTVLRAVGFAALWFILSDGDKASWVLGLPVVALATWISVVLQPVESLRLKWKGLLRFLPFFIWQSLLGSIDVARRALDPRLPLQPKLYKYEMDLSPENARVFFANTISLLPGTLAADMNGSGSRA